MSRAIVYLSGESQPILDPGRRFTIHAQPQKPNLGSDSLGYGRLHLPGAGPHLHAPRRL
ncbi:hypothetical protein [Variovorax sp. UC122_21]|uniref:hypothetical protein n=1 Tax=Variovorax sp. UC122_21 TaxID=3374554 RepID=UPI00375840EB